jgi:very-short-patch-repair endonuclease
VVYVAMRSRLVSAREVLAAAETIPRVTDRRGLERRLALAARGAESFLEEHAMTRVLATKAFRGLVYQHTVRVGRARFRLDALDLSTLTAFECDGSAMHDTALAVARDKRRDALLASVGILTVRFTYSDIMNRPEWCRRVAARVMQSRS